MSFRSEITAMLGNLLPTKTRTVIRGHQQPPAMAHVMDVDMIHGFLRLAESGDTTSLFGLYRDILAGHAHTQAEFNKRLLAVLGEPLTLTAIDPKDSAAVALAAEVQNHLTQRPAWVPFLSHNLASVLYPVSLTERCYRISGRPGWRYEIGDLQPVPHVHLAWPNRGDLSLKNTDDEGNFLGTFSIPEPRNFITHRGNLLATVPDWWGGPMRALVFWWLFSTCDRDWWVRFLDRFGSPFLEGKYSESDDRARYELQDAFSAATRLFGIVVSKDTELKMHQANSVGGGEAFLTFHKTANSEISKLIVGQTSSAEISSEGLGGSQGQAQAGVREDIRKFDAFCLSQMISTQVLAPLWRLNGWTSAIPTVSFGAVSEEEADLTGDLVASLFTAGIELSDAGLERLSGKLGLGLRRVPTLPPSVALSARSSLPILPPVAIRAARQRQARSAVAALVSDASPKLARLLSARAEALASAIADSDSPEAAAAAVASLAASYDPATAADLVSRVLTSASVNALVTLD